MTDYKKATREKRRTVTATVSYKKEYYENWGQAQEYIGVDDVVSDLSLDTFGKVGVGNVRLGPVEIKCDECSEWKAESEFNDAVTAAAQGKDYCKDCEQWLEDEDAEENGSDPQGGDGDDD